MKPWIEASSIFATSFFPALLSGPIPAIVFVWLVQQGSRLHRRVFWMVFSLWNVGMMFYFWLTMDINFLGPGMVACLFTPIASLISLLILALGRQQVRKKLNDDDSHSEYFWGLVFIPLVQSGVMIIAAVIAPVMCNTPLRECIVWP